MGIQADPVPLQMDQSGAIRVGQSRVTLDVIIAEYKKGASPEEIAREFDTVQLADIYAALAYYLRHQDEVGTYLLRRQEEAAEWRKKVEDAGMTLPELGNTVRERWSQKETPPDASSPE
jgi:uncharacterized protein (DUF433 family)